MKQLEEAAKQLATEHSRTPCHECMFNCIKAAATTQLRAAQLSLHLYHGRRMGATTKQRVKQKDYGKAKNKSKD